MSKSIIVQKFIAERERYSNNHPQLVRVYYVGDRPENACFANATQRQCESERRIGPKIIAVSGWLIDTSRQKLGGAVVIPHWWNYNTHNHLYFDHTKLADDHNVHFEYVLDQDLSLYYFSHQFELAGPTPKSLIRRRGAWMEVVETSEGVATRALADLRTDHLFHRIRRSTGAEADLRP
ncbi:MAG: hypothetical protein AB1429_11660 [Pseudomonadota bacterium]|jgi:hypothetical protein